MAVDLERRRFTAREYLTLVEMGVIGPEERVELIDGEIVKMASAGFRHVACVNRLNRAFTSVAGPEVIVQVQSITVISRRSVLEPDVVLLRYRDDFYANGGAPVDAIYLVVEVSESTVAYDRRVKGPLYAKAGIVEYWQVNLVDEHVVVLTDPRGGQYRSVQVYRRGETLAPAVLPWISVRVDDVLG